MTENVTATTHPCKVLRCTSLAAWMLTITDNGQHVTSGHYCPEHAARRVANMGKPGRRITLGEGVER